MADSDGEYVADMSDDDIMDHTVTDGDPSAARPKGAKASKKKRDRNGSKAWEQSKRTWETDLPEEDDGMLNLAGYEAERRRRLLRDTTPLQRGIIRHLVLVLDMSFAMAEKDLLPTRHRLTLSYAAAFVREYFEQNPISQLGIVGMRDGVAVRISDMGGNPAEHLERLRDLEGQDPQGNPSLQNALEMCRGALFHAPSHGTREVLIIYGALLSSDPGDIHDTIGNLIADRIRVSVVGLSAQVAICAELCSRTNAGDESQYNVAMDETHYRELFLAATTPPVNRTKEQSTSSLLMMGFPSRTLAPGGNHQLLRLPQQALPRGLSLHSMQRQGLQTTFRMSRLRTDAYSVYTSCSILSSSFPFAKLGGSTLGRSHAIHSLFLLPDFLSRTTQINQGQGKG
ncbi:uncharacterized protein TrAtP1_004115 [Trichoderma atroviride]|uniref:uncharacterized protein n=1 Tax=Hypocrea atroviridis TaxID=63577 RepID=UPI00332840DF|nr:hypothetical protein TrAtP1_004115 [Trichoderma atroviride]